LNLWHNIHQGNLESVEVEIIRNFLAGAKIMSVKTLTIEFTTDSRKICGHTNAMGAEAIGAARALTKFRLGGAIAGMAENRQLFETPEP